MLLTSLIPLYDRDLKALRKEIESYADEASIWKKAPGINNPADNVFLHLMGNLNTYIAAVYAKTGSYIFIHLETHLAYHLGQINYHRRLLDQ